MNLEVNKIFEDSDLIVIDKPAGLVVHPGAGNEKTTLVDWLIEKYPEIKNLNWPDKTRAGIVHRLDKDTSGLMILAKNPEVLEKLQAVFKRREVHKSYLALIYGKLDKPAGEIKSLISRDPNARRQQVSRSIFFDFEPGKKREAKTKYNVIKEYDYHGQALSLIEATLETGRTHQIRVHFKSIGHPILGDQTYNIKHSRKISKEVNLHRQFLHSHKLEFIYDNKKLTFKSTPPTDLVSAIKTLE